MEYWSVGTEMEIDAKVRRCIFEGCKSACILGHGERVPEGDYSRKKERCAFVRGISSKSDMLNRRASVPGAIWSPKANRPLKVLALEEFKK
jgi:hypothetical protein